MSKQQAAELFPNLFAKPSATPRNVSEMKPQDLRLLQYCMRKAGKARPGATTARSARFVAAR